MLSCLVPGAWPSTGTITTRLMIWIVVAVNLCVCDKRRIIPFTEKLCRRLDPAAAVCLLLPNQRRYLKLNRLSKLLWCWGKDREGTAMPVTDVLVQLPFCICRHCSTFTSQSPFSWIPTVLWARQSLEARLDLSVFSLSFHIVCQGSKRMAELSKVVFPHS